jgi:pimeloyl-ACP methyl ester carboxylesterase
MVCTKAGSLNGLAWVVSQLGNLTHQAIHLNVLAMSISHIEVTQFLDLPGGRLAYEISGPEGGPLVLCTPGMGDIRQAYRLMVKPLVAAGLRVVLMDQRGHGQSTSQWADYGGPLTGQDMIALIKHLHEPAAIVGHSSSAAAAVWAAAEEPTLVSALVLLGPFARQRDLPAMMRLALAAVTSRAAIWSRIYYPTMYKAAKPDDFAAYVRTLQANLGEPGRMAATRGAMNRQPECFDRVAELDCPVLVVMGSRDPDFADPAAEAAYAHQLIGAHTRTDIAMVDGAGHYPHAELPDVTASAIRIFLAAAISA